MALKDYFLKTAELNVDPRHFLDLFECPENNTRQMELMGDHIDRFSDDANGCVQNVFIIYLGHGLPQAGITALSIRATTKRDAAFTALKVQDLADQIKKLAAWSRRILILDCCYAAGALKPWLDADGGLAKTTEQAFETQETQEVRDDPTRGTTVLCASDKYSKAKAPVDKTYTLFSGLLLDVLRNGKPGGPSVMTLENIVQMVSDKLRKRGEGPIPVLVSPDTTEGDLGNVLRLFPNPARGSERKVTEPGPRQDKTGKWRSFWIMAFIGTAIVSAFAMGAVVIKAFYFQDIVADGKANKRPGNAIAGTPATSQSATTSASTRLLFCKPAQVLNSKETLLVKTASINIDGAKAILSFSARSTGECAPKGQEASNLTFRLMQGETAITPYENAEPAGVADSKTETPHYVDVSSKFAQAYWNTADGCEISMPGQAHCPAAPEPPIVVASAASTTSASDSPASARPPVWVYLGFSTGNALQSETFDLQHLPANGEKILGITSVSTRAAPPQYENNYWVLGKSLGVLKKGQSAVVLKLSFIDSTSPGSKVVWAQVSLD